MANHKSALKRNRQNIKRNLRNRAGRSTLRTAVKNFRTALEGDAPVSASQLHAVMSTVAGAGAKGFIPKQTASRTIARLSKAWQAKQG